MNINDLQPLINWVNLHPYYAYLLIFLLSLSESLVIVGLIVPGIAIMTIVGTFVGTGYLAFWPTFIASVAGAIVGDGVSYWVGQQFQEQIREWWVFRKFPDLISRCERFFSKHGSKSVVFGRFVGPVRPMIPAVAGMMKMPALNFYAVNIISALLWAPVYLFPGVIFGNTVSLFSPEVRKKLIILLFISMLAIWFIVKVIKSLWHYFKYKFRKVGARILIYAENNSLQYLQKIIKHPLTHKKHQVDSFLFLIVLIIVSSLFIAFTKYRYIVTELNTFFKHLALIVYEPQSNLYLLMLDNISSIPTVTCIFMSIILLLIATTKLNRLHSYIFDTPKTQRDNNSRIKRNNILICYLLLGYFIAHTVISQLLQYPSPFNIPGGIWYSFPDVSIGLFLLLLGYIGIVKYCNSPRQYKRSNFTFYTIVLIIIACIIKILLGHHWLSDIIGSLLITACLLIIFCIVYWQNPLENLNLKHFNIAISSIIIAVIAISTSIFYFTVTKDELKHYNISMLSEHSLFTTISHQQWQNTNHFTDSTLPIINAQWLSQSKDEIEKNLLQQGWSQQTLFNFTTMMQMFEKNPQIKDIPILPLYFQDRSAKIIFNKLESNNKLLNIQLWQSDYKINNKYLWVGTVQYLKPEKFFNLVTSLRHWPRAEFADAADKLLLDIKKNNKLQTKMIIDNNNAVDEQLKIILIN